MGMPSPGRCLLLAAALLLATGLMTQLAVGRKKDKPPRATPTSMDTEKRAVHALNRLTFGPRPGDVERVTEIGVNKWIELQLRPDKIDDSRLASRLAPFRTLRMETKEIVENFPPNQLIKQIADGKASMPRDPAERAVYEAQLERYEDKRERKDNNRRRESDRKDKDDKDNDKHQDQDDKAEPAASRVAGDPQNAPAAPRPSRASDGNKNDGTKNGLDSQDSFHKDSFNQDRFNQDADSDPMRRREQRRLANVRTQELLDLPADERMQQILEMSANERRALGDTAKGAKADALMEGMSPKQKETVMALNNPEQVVVNELMQAKMLRAIYSERQLDEVMTDFWFNHFNVFINKGADRYLLTSYERDAIRPHVLGKFEDLLVATAKSPAMLFYLDNWLSVGPDSEIALGSASHRVNSRGSGPGSSKRGKGKPASGLNENYGRELMELHTLSVNGGYSQKDVTEVAKVFTGWTLEQPKKGGDFRFEPRMHEPGDKIVLGHRIRSNGEREGLEVLHLLAHNPKTAHFISQKLAMRFVADDPPAALVDQMTQTFLNQNGDIREVLRSMFRSPEFWSPAAYRAKVKTPLEFVVSAVRASGAEVEDARALVATLNTMGMMPYSMMPPTGYSMKADSWVNSSALLGRMNFALKLADGKVHGVKVDSASLAAGTAAEEPVQAAALDPQQALAALENSLLAGDISRQTHDTISQRLDDSKISQRKLDDRTSPPDVAAIAGLILGSPEFQKR
jgi:uncharacterized protein (DUF1800 family)